MYCTWKDKSKILTTSLLQNSLMTSEKNDDTFQKIARIAG